MGCGSQIEIAVGTQKVLLPEPGGRVTGCTGWLHLTYHAALYSSAARPVIRFLNDVEETHTVMSASLFGCGAWIGRMPAETRRVEILLPGGSPPEGFSLTSASVLSNRELLALAWPRNAPKAGLAALLRAAGLKAVADALLTSLFGASPMRQYHEWRERNRRELDFAGLERRRESWAHGPHIRVVLLDEGPKPAEALRATVSSVERQAYPNWSIAFVGEGTVFGDNQRVVHIAANASTETLWCGLSESDILLPISAGDEIADYAMGALVEFASTRPDYTLFYADEDSIDAGRYVAPQLKPDWSPIFQRSRSFVGRAVYARCRALEAHRQLPLAEMLRPSAWDALFTAESGPVGHIRRVLLTKMWRPAEGGRRLEAVKSVGLDPSATIIVPTRDREKLTAACLASLEMTMPGRFDLLIVDNGSTSPAMRRLLERVEGRPGIRVLEAAGPFNFSALCNRAAEYAEGQVLVFLNNDTEVLRPDWLSSLTGWAVQPDVGAVGAKLVYPSGRLQHAGLVLGLGGYAAHIDIGAPSAYPGYLDRFTVPHEVSAVTGACLAVEKRKFEAIGGFDADRFPVELGDVDLCLRLAERGWKTVLTPDALLMHRESATRGRSDVARRYAAERRHFQARWRERIRDDPYFHPALSLTARRTSLDR